MVERLCRYCERSFLPSKFQPGQLVCGQPECQRQRRADNRRRKLAADPEYRQTCLESARKWRARNADYWPRYREQHPAAAERNRQQQHLRDQKQRLRQLANNNSAFDLKHGVAQIWLLGANLQSLANNNSAPAQVWILEAIPPRKPPASVTCKQQPAGVPTASAG